MVNQLASAYAVQSTPIGSGVALECTPNEGRLVLVKGSRGQDGDTTTTTGLIRRERCVAHDEKVETRNPPRPSTR